MSGLTLGQPPAWMPLPGDPELERVSRPPVWIPLPGDPDLERITQHSRTRVIRGGTYRPRLYPDPVLEEFARQSTIRKAGTSPKLAQALAQLRAANRRLQAAEARLAACRKKCSHAVQESQAAAGARSSRTGRRISMAQPRSLQVTPARHGVPTRGLYRGPMTYTAG